jgi:hypothetical protein
MWSGSRTSAVPPSTATPNLRGVAVAAIIISLTTFAWTVASSVYEFRQRSRREIRVRAWLGWATVPGKEGPPFVTIDVSAVNIGNVPVTLRAASARILGGRSLPIQNWLRQEPKSLGSRAVLSRGEAWVGLLDMTDFIARVEQVADTPKPWRIVFDLTDADENRYELDEADAIELHADD